MIFTEEINSQIYELAKALTPPAEISALLDIPEDLLDLELSNKTSGARKAFMKGKAETAHMLRSQQLELARIGSPVAVQLTYKYLIDMSADSDL